MTRRENGAMASPFYQVIQGHFVIVGKEPDGDSVRFIADNPKLYRTLKRSFRIKPSNVDKSVQLRFEGIDAPELHYGAAVQPLGKEARDQLLDWMGFTNIEFTGNKVTASDPEQIPGAILSVAAEANGRPVSYVLLDAKKLDDGQWVKVDDALLKQTLNFRLLEAGLAYYTVYTSAPLSHREFLRQVASKARDKKLGVWGEDRTSEFVLIDQKSISPPDGQLILPKLFRRCTDYLKAVEKGFRGNLGDWLISTEGSSRMENDRVVVMDAMELKLSDLLEQRNSRIAFQADLLDIVFVEK
jgi:endonuclease YncB( thermonuclease family)